MTPTTHSRANRTVALASVLALMVAAFGAAPAATADDDCDISWTGAEGDAWTDPDNWDADPARVPGVDDVVCVASTTGLPIVHDRPTDTLTEVAALIVTASTGGDPALDLRNGRFRLNEASRFETARLVLSGGELDHNTSLRLGGGLTWTGGDIRDRRLGDPTTTLQSDSTIASDSAKALVGTTIEVEADVVLRNEGTVSMFNNATILGAGTFVNAPGAEVNDLGAGAGVANLEVAVTNEGDWRPRGRGFTFTGGMTSSGTFRPTFGTTTTFGGTDTVYRFTADSVTTSATSAFDNITYIVDGNAELVVEPGADFSMQGDNLLRGGGLFAVFTVNEDIELGRFTWFRNLIQGAGSIHASGDVLLAGVTIEGADGTELRVGGDLAFYGGSGPRYLRAGRDLIVEGDVTDRRESASNSTGLFRIETGARMTIAGDYDHAGDDLDLLGQLEVGGTHRLSGSASLRGTGTVTGTVENAARVGPGTSPGTLAIDGDYEQTDEGTLAIELAGTDDSEFDVLEITGSASLDGELDVRAIDGFVPEVGDTFDILVADDITGSFSTESLPDLGEDAQMFVLYGSEVVRLIVTDGTEPDPITDPEPEPDPIADPDPGTDPAPEEDAPPSGDDGDGAVDDDAVGDEAAAEEAPIAQPSDQAESAAQLPRTGTDVRQLGALALLTLLLGFGVLASRRTKATARR